MHPRERRALMLWRMNSAILGIPLLATVLAGCGAPKARPLIAEARWAEACQALYPQDPLEPTEVRDIERWEFDELVLDRAGARVGAIVMPRHVVEHVLGASRKVRPSPSEAQGVFDEGNRAGRVARELVKGHAFVLWRVEAKGPFPVLFDAPLFERKEPSGVSEVSSRALDIGSSASLGNLLGFAWPASSCNEGLTDMVKRAGKSLVNQTSGVGCSSSASRDPTPDERALIDQVAPRLAFRCSAESASCTQYGFVKPYDVVAPTTNLVRFTLTVKVSSTCSVLELFEVPIAETPVLRADGSLRALFPSGMRPVGELSALSKAEAPLPVALASAPALPVDGARCVESEACRRQGHCFEALGRCYIGSDADCRGSELCRTDGFCSAEPGKTTVSGAMLDGLCVAATDNDCNAAEACRVGGFCHAEGRLCVAKSAGDCRGSEACTRFGLCSYADGVCRVLSDADCRSATVCTAFGACRAEAGLCR